MGTAMVQAKNWRLATFVTLGFVAFPCVLGLIYLGAQPKAVPHIVEVHQDGSAAYRGPVGHAWSDYSPGNAQIKYHLWRFLANTRSVSSDLAVIKHNWMDAYTLVTPRAGRTLNQYATDFKPFEQAEHRRVNVEMLAANPISADSWQIDWKETQWTKEGHKAGDRYWRAMFKIMIAKPQTEAQLAANPIGVYIDEFNWSKIVR